MTNEESKAKTFDTLRFIADNAGLSTFEAIEKAYNMGVSEQQPCEDCISRQAVLDAIDNIDWYHISNKGELVQGANKQTMPLYKAADIFYAIDALPSVTPQQTSWIPVSERLPEGKIDTTTNDFEIVLCSTVWNDVRPYKFGKPIGHAKAHFWDGGGVMDDYVIAWMPLPQPYKADMRGD